MRALALSLVTFAITLGLGIGCATRKSDERSFRPDDVLRHERLYEFRPTEALPQIDTYRADFPEGVTVTPELITDERGRRYRLKIRWSATKGCPHWNVTAFSDTGGADPRGVLRSKKEIDGAPDMEFTSESLLAPILYRFELDCSLSDVGNLVTMLVARITVDLRSVKP